MNLLSRLTQNTSERKSTVPDAMVASEGSAISQQKRKSIEQGFCGAKTVGHIRQVIALGLEKVDRSDRAVHGCLKAHVTAHAGTGAHTVCPMIEKSGQRLAKRRLEDQKVWKFQNAK